MSDDATPRLSLPYIAAGQAQKHVTVNEALGLLDGLVQTAVESRTTTAQPSSPPDGALYILPAGATGLAWSSGAEGEMVRFEAGGWTWMPAAVGALAWAKDEATMLVHHGAGWSDLFAAASVFQNLSLLGLGTTADADNPLAAKLSKALFTAKAAGEGGDGDLRLTFNKEGASNVLSLLFQTSYSGRAEVGLVGDDDLAFKLSGDGAAWRQVMTLLANGVAVVDHSLRLSPQSTAPTGAAAGQIYFDSTLGKFRGYTGSAWADLN